MCFFFFFFFVHTGFTDWTITRNGGDQFIHESEPSGCHPVKNFAKCDNITGKPF